MRLLSLLMLSREFFRSRMTLKTWLNLCYATRSPLFCRHALISLVYCFSNISLITPHLLYDYLLHLESNSANAVYSPSISHLRQSCIQQKSQPSCPRSFSANASNFDLRSPSSSSSLRSTAPSLLTCNPTL